MISVRFPALFRLFILTLPLLLVACGFQPLHGKSGRYDAAVKDYLSQTRIENIPNREGQMLRNVLIDRFYLYGHPAEPDYILQVLPIRQTLRDLDITKSSDATRAQLRLDTAMVLREARTKEVVLKRDLTAITSFNILDSQFTTRVSQEDAREGAIMELARRIETYLGLYYKSL